MQNVINFEFGAVQQCVALLYLRFSSRAFQRALLCTSLRRYGRERALQSFKFPFPPRQFHFIPVSHRRGALRGVRRHCRRAQHEPDVFPATRMEGRPLRQLRPRFIRRFPHTCGTETLPNYNSNTSLPIFTS